MSLSRRPAFRRKRHNISIFVNAIVLVWDDKYLNLASDKVSHQFIEVVQHPSNRVNTLIRQGDGAFGRFLFYLLAGNR